MDTVVVTRHASLVQLLVERGIIAPGATVIEHATEADIAGKHVIGVLPLRLACHAVQVTEVALAIEPSDRGVELTIERLREIAGPPTTYVVTRVG